MATSAVACRPSGSVTVPTRPTPTETATPTETGLVTTVDPHLVEHGVVTCPDPGLRELGPLVAHTIDQDAPTGFYLHGAALVVDDLDGDGRLDVFAPGEVQQLLFWGQGGGLLGVDGSAALDGLPLDSAVGAAQADYDGDGDLDLVVTRWKLPATLLRNDGGRTFTDVTEAALGADLPAWRTQSAAWGDMDGDGDLDLFMGSYGTYADLDVLDPEPDCSDHVSEPSELWRNEGDGTFTDVSDTLPPEVHDGYVFMAGWYDLDLDGLPELVTAHDDALCGPGLVLRNQGGALVVDPDRKVPANGGCSGMGMAVGDLNADEVPDFLMTSWNLTCYSQSSAVAPGGWVDYTAARGLQPDAAPLSDPNSATLGQQVFGWGTELGDVDNDADLDAIAVFGFWSVYDGAGDPRLQTDGLWLQGADGSFTDEAAAWGLDHLGAGRSVVLADLDDDGWLDVVKRVQGSEVPLHLSRCGEASWARVRLQGPPPNTFGVGARVRVTTASGTQLRWITAGSTGMYSGRPLEAHFGLGDHERIDVLEVEWPDGATSRFDDVSARQRLTVLHPTR